ncbi:CAP domain-containing protein [Streptomyces sp. NBC_01264]|uniref:CAP domain-containing protein n=1 Tax=Streptomyces sp. NBC_01264 TaxID=2903804 RepID=UPI0022544AF6|nr:CAP domain-containing protein [Streptomyces sp. NBC_01264]MCX4776034.1 CAP domain-containing protein [Streptomyces sp. NBC_01264]
MSRSRTPGTPSRVEARRKKTVRTRIVLSLTAAGAVVAVGVAVAASDDGAGGSGAKARAVVSGGQPSAESPSSTPSAPAPSADTASATGAMPSAAAGTDPTGSAAPAKSATESRPAPAAPAAKPKPKPTRTSTGTTTTGGGSGGSGGSSGSSGSSAVESAVLALVNKERAAAGCGALATNAKLSAAARAYSDTMARSGVMSHTGPDGSTMTSRVEAAGYGWSRLGENIARGQADAAAVMKAWMNSPGHKANILNCGFREIGIGFHKGDGGPWWTQDFGTAR